MAIMMSCPSPSRSLRVVVAAQALGHHSNALSPSVPKSVHLSRSLELQRLATYPERTQHQVHANTATAGSVAELSLSYEHEPLVPVELRFSDPTTERETSTSGRAEETVAAASPAVPGRVTDVHSMEAVEDLVTQNPTKLVVLDCHTRLCGPCKLMEPVYQGFANHFEDAIFVRVDTAENCSTRALSGHLKVDSLPAFFAWRNGKLVGSCKGAQDQVLKKMLVDNTAQGEAGYVLPCFRPKKAAVRGGGPRSLNFLPQEPAAPQWQGSDSAPLGTA